MKYIDAEKLKAEIERRRLSNRYIDTEGYEEELYEIIDSLQQEQTEGDLEEAAEEYVTDWTTCYAYEIKQAFIAGAKWMASQKPLPEDTAIFQKGVEEGKRLMMENALEGVAHPDDCEIWVNTVGYGYDIKDGDKVKVIIVEEENKIPLQERPVNKRKRPMKKQVKNILNS